MCSINFLLTYLLTYSMYNIAGGYTCVSQNTGEEAVPRTQYKTRGLFLDMAALCPFHLDKHTT